jgi:hypothetical protein
MKYKTLDDIKKEGFTYLFTFGLSLDVYGKEDIRVAIDKKTNEVYMVYTFTPTTSTPESTTTKSHKTKQLMRCKR